MKSLFAHFLYFIKFDIWRIRARNLPPQKSFWLRSFRVVLISFKEFVRDRCPLWASALTFFTLLSIVPVLAMAFGVAKGFGFEQVLEGKLLENFQGQQEVVERIIDFSHALLANTRGGIIAGIGLIILFWTIIRVLGNIEKSFNAIWGVKRDRRLSRKFSDYLSIMLIAPILIVTSSSLTVFVTSQVEHIVKSISWMGVFAPLILFALNFAPFVLLWLLLTLIYVLMPNTKVKISSALLGGVIAGTLYQVAQWAYIHFQIGASRYGAVYGSFAALPLFLIWLQISWFIILYGAEIAFAFQNEQTFEFEHESSNVSHDFKRLMLLWITQYVIRAYTSGAAPPTVDQIISHFDIPMRLTRSILHDLTESGVLVEVVKRDTDEVGYQPGRPVDELTLVGTIRTFEEFGVNDLPINSNKDLNELQSDISSLKEKLAHAEENQVLK